MKRGNGYIKIKIKRTFFSPLSLLLLNYIEFATKNVQWSESLPLLGEIELIHENTLRKFIVLIQYRRIGEHKRVLYHLTLFRYIQFK